MSRRRRPIRREILPDPVYADTLVTKFVNCMMIDGKKSASEKIFYGALDIVLKKAAGEEPLQMFKRALENLKPQVEVKSRRVGGATYQVPVEVSPERQNSIALRWVAAAAFHPFARFHHAQGFHVRSHLRGIDHVFAQPWISRHVEIGRAHV